MHCKGDHLFSLAVCITWCPHVCLGHGQSPVITRWALGPVVIQGCIARRWRRQRSIVVVDG